MLYQIGLILILIVIALVIGKKFKTPVENKEPLIYEDEMSPDELRDLDEEIN
ncbi:hypothetical protein OAU16_02365 [Gammaproteobacteria bacterium]|nr:hypothetical protein [Gammaproteobacteria bacterium]